MERVEPKVYLVAATKLDHAPLHKYLETIGAPDWDSDAPSDGEKLIEFMGRQCYFRRAWQTIPRSWSGQSRSSGTWRRSSRGSRPTTALTT